MARQVCVDVYCPTQKKHVIIPNKLMKILLRNYILSYEKVKTLLSQFQSDSCSVDSQKISWTPPPHTRANLTIHPNRAAFSLQNMLLRVTRNYRENEKLSIHIENEKLGRLFALTVMVISNHRVDSIIFNDSFIQIYDNVTISIKTAQRLFNPNNFVME